MHIIICNVRQIFWCLLFATLPCLGGEPRSTTTAILAEASAWRPACAITGRPDAALTALCEQQADWLAASHAEGHPNWPTRRSWIQAAYPNARWIEEDMTIADGVNTPSEAARKALNHWRLGHWVYINSPTAFYAFAMSRGNDGVWKCVWMGVK